VHEAKQFEPTISTLPGIKIDRSEEWENASDSIRVNRELDSNETDLGDLHRKKHSEPRISISRGIITAVKLERFRINL
jgi:hypothetical protein